MFNRYLFNVKIIGFFLCMLSYLSREDVLSGKLKQLVGGVAWILRNGTGFVNKSKMLECEDTEETGIHLSYKYSLKFSNTIG